MYVQAMVARLQAGNVSAAFNTWKERATSHQAQQDKLRAAVMKLTQSHLAAAWSSWRSQAQFAARAKAVVRTAISRLKQQVGVQPPNSVTMHSGQDAEVTSPLPNAA